ncbi:unnamed protein product [Fusarium graminearum]|uniref:Uncharacterized protein n=1 Tax=Gibberella zeae TaxID=5518 RepID=A0A9N8R8V0_GIBZA|nr:unnamed protein product [Fusarium graminearum]
MFATKQDWLKRTYFCLQSDDIGCKGFNGIRQSAEFSNGSPMRFISGRPNEKGTVGKSSKPNSRISRSFLCAFINAGDNICRASCPPYAGVTWRCCE